MLVEACRQDHQADVDYYDTLKDSFPLEIPKSCEFFETLMSAMKSAITEMAQTTDDDRLMYAQVLGELQGLYVFHTKDKRSLQTVEKSPGVSVYQCCFVDHLTDFLAGISASRIEICTRISLFGRTMMNLASVHDSSFVYDDEVEVLREISVLKKQGGQERSQRESLTETTLSVPDVSLVPVESLLVNEPEITETSNDVEDLKEVAKQQDGLSDMIPMLCLHTSGIISQVQCVSLGSFEPQEAIKFEEPKCVSGPKESTSFFKKLFCDNVEEQKHKKHRHSGRKRHSCRHK